MDRILGLEVNSNHLGLLQIMAMLRFCGSFGDCDKMPEAISWRRGKFDEFDLETVSDIFVYGWLHSLAM